MGRPAAGLPGAADIHAFYYIFFSAIEIACTLFIIWYAWTWRRPKGGAVTSGHSRVYEQAESASPMQVDG